MFGRHYLVLNNKLRHVPHAPDSRSSAAQLYGLTTSTGRERHPSLMLASLRKGIAELIGSDCTNDKKVPHNVSGRASDA